jgi:hypothetical protein
MKIKVLLTLSIAALAAVFSACSPAATTSMNTNKPANTAVAVNSTANSNPAANTSAPAAGDVVKIDEAGIQMVVPKGFKFSRDGADTLVSTDDEGVEIRFTVPADGDYDKARANAAKEIDEYVKDVKIDEKDVKKTVNGMEALTYSGTGKDEDGKEVLWEMTIFKTDKKPVLAIIYAEKPSMEKHSAGLKAFFDSVKKQ